MDIFFWLWLADISESLAISLTVVSTVLGIGLLFFPMIADAVSTEFDVQKILKRGVFVVALCLLTVALLPSKTTIYIGLAATKTEQVLEKASANPTVQKARRLLEQKLDEALAPKSEK